MKGLPMNDEIVRLGKEDFDEAMDFLALVFSVHAHHDFTTLLPKLYRPTEELMGCNFAIRDNGRIMAIVGLFPMTWQVGEATIKVGGIGGVSTHKKVRGKGYMQRLMKHCVEDMKAAGYGLSYLGGQRQRYGYFGYEKCGMAASYSISGNNLRHAFKEASALRFEPLEADHAERLAQARAMHQEEQVRVLRGADDFHRFLLSWNNRPHVALDNRGTMVGYLVASGSGNAITELGAKDQDTQFEMIRAWTQGQDGSVQIKLPPWNYRLGQRLGLYCESNGMNGSGSWQVFDWVEVVDALLKVRHAALPLTAGRVLLEIDGYGAICLEVEGDEARCSRSQGGTAWRCDPLTAHRLLFGPMPVGMVTDVPDSAMALHSWGPLPLYWGSQDGV